MTDQKQCLAAALKSMGETVITIDHEGNITFMNHCAEATTGWKQAEIVGQKFSKSIQIIDEMDNIISENIVRNAANGRVVIHSNRLNARLLNKTGSEIAVEIRSAPIKNDNEEIGGTVFVFRDVTESNKALDELQKSHDEWKQLAAQHSAQLTKISKELHDLNIEHKRLQEELAREHRLELAGRVAGQIAHDFNNLLSPLTAYPAFIRESLPPDHPDLHLVEEMESVAEKIAGINQQLLALGRRGHYTMEHIELNALIHKVVVSQKLPDEIVIKEELANDLQLIKGGEGQLTRVLINMLNNAVEAMQGKGTLTIKTENAYLEKPLKRYHAVKQGEYVKIEISDTGIGISPEMIENVFDPFFSTKTMDRERGSGLGLNVVYGIVEDHRGYATLESTLGNGTTFSLYFPISVAARKSINKASEVIKGGYEKILVVDDDPIQRSVATHILSRLGYQINQAESGEEAVQCVKENPHDLLVLDMMMDGIDGTETYRQILEFNPTQKAVILSGFAMSPRMQEALRLGAETFISKPISPNALITTVRKMLDKKCKSK